MSVNDVMVRDLLTQYGIILSLAIALLSLICWRWAKFQQSTFKGFLLGFESECSELASAHKRRLFSPLKQLISCDEALRTSGRIRLLEIGVKTGDNIQYYPEGTHFIGVDWNRRLKHYLINGEKSWQLSHINIERIITGDGSSLNVIPSKSVDAVVTTRSLCAAKSIRETLKEIHRILAPGGKFFFFEHVPDDQGTFVKWIQSILTKTKIWPSLFGGCRLDSDPLKEIENGELFKEVEWEKITLQGYVSQPHHLLLSRHHIIGSATR